MDLLLAAADVVTDTAAGNLVPLTPAQHNIVSNVFSFTVATMGASALFFFNARSQVAPKYRFALMISGLVVAIACYHYFRIYDSWEAAFELKSGVFQPTGKPFNDFYRYADWILTVPLLMVELVAVMALPTAEARSLITRLVIAAMLMIGLGYPGEISPAGGIGGARFIWGLLSSIPFVYILYVLFVELTKSLARQPEQVRVLISNLRLVILATWGFYPIAYILYDNSPFGPASGLVAIQIGYAIADVTAKAFFGVMIYYIALLKSEAEGFDHAVATTSPASVN